MTTHLPPRFPWPEDFPEVIVHGEEKVRDAHPNYLDAKAGNFRSAFWLVEDIIRDDTPLDQLKKICEQFDPVLLPVTADEAGGFNAIPDALASSLWFELGCEIEEKGRIVQSNKVAHTRAPGFQRIVTPASFSGEVRKGARYILVDDHAGFGGTLANLRGYVEVGGATVIGTTTLTASPNSQCLAVSKGSLNMIYSVYGTEIDEFWRNRFGHGINCLTEREAVLVARQRSLDALEACLAQATSEVRARGL
jgi:hypothetical protein